MKQQDYKNQEAQTQKALKRQAQKKTFEGPDIPKLLGCAYRALQETLRKARLARYKKYQLYPDERVYAKGFGPDSKLINLLKTPVGPKTAGIVVLLTAACAIVFSGISVFTLFYRGPQIDQTALIKASQVQIIRADPVIAGGKPVKWTALVKRSQIKENQHLIQLPKGAKNITIKTVSTDQAKQILTQQPLKDLTTKERQSLASLTPQKPKSIFTRLTSLLFASAKDAIDKLTGTSDSTLVDLSDQIIEEEPTKQEEKQEQKEKTKEEKQEEKESKKEAKEETKEELLGPTPQELPAIEVPQESLLETVSPSDQPVIIEEQPPAEEEQQPVIEEPAPEPEYVVVEYETPAPEITEQETDTGKMVTVSAPDELEYKNVLAYTTIPEIYKVGQENKIKIKWQNNDGQEMPFTAYDLNDNGRIDYLEWTVPHLSDQTFLIIYISKAFELDQNREIIEDIYDLVKEKDKIWASIGNNQYVRVTFEQILDNTKDNTIYAKPTDPAQPVIVEVYPVYTDQDGNTIEGSKVATFPTIDHEDAYKVLLTNLQIPTDMFDLKIIGNIDIDYIVDPTVGDSFSGETKIGFGIVGGVHSDSTNVAINNGITIAPCYTATAGWTQVVVTDHNPANCSTNSTYVRDLSVTSDGTHYVCKDIWCDNTDTPNVCILYTAGSTPPNTVCIATDTNVYPQTILGYGLLWAKADITGNTAKWAAAAPYTTQLLSTNAGDVGGAHTTNKVGSNDVSISSSYNWMERYYTSPVGSYPAMDACKALGLGWRVPTILELDSIRDSTAINSIYSRLPNIVANTYWSSSEYSSTIPFSLRFYLGDVSTYRTKSTADYVRCVRGY